MKHLLQHFKTLTKHPQNAEELKGLILQLAIQGKLTENWRQENPNVESASELLKEVKEERANLIAKKKIRKEKVLPQIKEDEYPFIIPNNWCFCRMGDLFSMTTGKGYKKAEYSENGVRLFQIANVSFGKTSWDIKVFLPESYIRMNPGHSLFEGDLVMALNRPLLGRKLKVAKLTQEDTPSIIYQRVGRFNYHLFDFSDWHLIYLQSPQFIDWLLEQVRGINIPFVNQTKLYQHITVLPPLEEQKAIVEIVNELFKEVDQLEEQTKTRKQLKEDYVSSALQRLTQANNVDQEWQFLQTHFTEFFTEKENIKQLRDTILQLAVQGKLTSKWRTCHPELVEGSHHASELLKRIQAEKQQLINQKKIKKEKALPPIEDHEKPYELPEGWVWCRLGTYAHYGALTKCENKDASKSTWVLELEDIEKESSKLLQKVRFADRDFKSTKSVFKSSDVIYGKLRPYLDKVIVADEDGVCTTEMIPIKSFSNSSPDYLRWYLKHPDFIEYANSSTHGMRMPRMGTDVAKKAIVSIPPLEEQKAIVKQVNSLMALCDSLEEHIENSQTQIAQLMQSCLREVFEND